MRKDINFDQNDDYSIPTNKKSSVKYVIVDDDNPRKFYQNYNSFISFVSEYPDAYVWEGAEQLKYAKNAATRAAKKLKQCLVIIENYGSHNERQVYTAAYIND